MSAYPAGVPYRALLEALRPEHHRTLVGLEALLASARDPGMKLAGHAIEKFKSLLIDAEDCLRRGPREAASDQTSKISDGYIPTMADVRAAYDAFDQCGHWYVEQQMSQLRTALKNKTCTCCPDEYVPLRTYLVLPKNSETFADERRRMAPFASELHRATFRNALAMIEHRGFTDAMWSIRSSLWTGKVPGHEAGTIRECDIRSPEIQRHCICIRHAADLASKLFLRYYFPQIEPVSDERFIAEWAKPMASRLAAWMNNIRNFMIDEVNEMLDLAQPLPRIEGVGVFLKKWQVKEIPAPAGKLDLRELEKEFAELMSFALEHRYDDPLAKPRPRPTSPKPPHEGARLMRRPLRPKLPPRQKRTPKDDNGETSRRGSSPGK